MSERRENTTLPPGHPAAGSTAVPSAGEQLSRGGDEMPVPGDDVLLEEQEADE